MKNTIIYWIALLFIYACQSNQSQEHSQDHSKHSQHQPKQELKSDTAKGSPKRMAMTNIGNAHVHIEYNSPAVRKRIIWGGLVAFDQVWVTGAHNATSISFSEDVMIAGKKINKGKYAFFTIPSEKEWTLILNKNWEQHLTDEYSEKEDVLRWKSKPEPNEHTERLIYQVISQGNDKGKVEMIWEKVKISFEIAQVK